MHSFNKIWVILLIIFSCFIFLYSIDFANKFYNNFFRLSLAQVSDLLIKNKSQCEKISDCVLLPGDILIRRYVTERTWIVDKLAHPYFTHAAFYLGDGQLIEAVGTEKNTENDIQITTLSKSDWLNSDIEEWVVIRSKNITPKLNSINTNLINIAKDEEYVFGLPKPGDKKYTCADLIFSQLKENELVNIFNAPKIITPDYLFFTTINDSNFKVVGYHIVALE